MLVRKVVLPESLGPANTIHCTGLDLAKSRAVVSLRSFPLGKRMYSASFVPAFRAADKSLAAEVGEIGSGIPELCGGCVGGVLISLLKLSSQACQQAF